MITRSVGGILSLYITVRQRTHEPFFKTEQIFLDLKNKKKFPKKKYAVEIFPGVTKPEKWQKSMI